MRATYFVLASILSLVLAGWLLLRMVIHTDPEVPANVAIVLLLLFLFTASLTSLLSWALVRRLWGEERFAMAVRHGVWAGLFLLLLPVLRWLDTLSVLVIGAVLLIILGLESLILLHQGQGEEGGQVESRE